MSRQYREKLYHGTVSEIIRVDVAKGRGNRAAYHMIMT